MTLTILADDLTGACDTGALFARGAVVPVTVWPAGPPTGAVRVIDTESRSLDDRAAADRVRRAAAMTPALRYFKKIDSTLRGRIAAEVGALMDGTGSAGALLCPAFPAQRRTVRDRLLLVDGTPVTETPVARDPQFPRATSSDIVEIVRSQLRGLDDATARWPAPGWISLSDVRAGAAAVSAHLQRLAGAIVVADAETDADLGTLVDAVLSLPRCLILAGSAGLAGALARGLDRFAETVPVPPALRWLILVGSRHPASRRQIEPARRAGLTVLATNDQDVTPAPDAACRVAEAAKGLLRREGFDMIAATGGETAVALYRELGARRIDLAGAPGPGLALGRLCASDFGDPWIITKAGGFGDPDLYATLAAQSRERAEGD